jgi:hypothetical protein
MASEAKFQIPSLQTLTHLYLESQIKIKDLAPFMRRLMPCLETIASDHLPYRWLQFEYTDNKMYKTYYYRDEDIVFIIRRREVLLRQITWRGPLYKEDFVPWQSEQDFSGKDWYRGVSPVRYGN